MNRLSQASSPYLLQHRDNPVHWWEWQPEAFAQARRLGVLQLALTGGEESGELIGHLVANGGCAVTWWDREADDTVAAEVFVASARAQEAGVQHRVLGLREDVDGRRGEPGRSARAAAAQALRTTWGQEAEGLPPVSVALDQALPDDAVVWTDDYASVLSVLR